MPLLIFPPSPTNGQLFPASPLPNQQQYEWSSTESTWRLLGAATTIVPGCYGDSANVAAFCVDAQGRLTSAVNVPSSLQRVTAPTSSTDPGAIGEIAFSSGFLYFYDGAQWLQVAGSTF